MNILLFRKIGPPKKQVLQQEDLESTNLLDFCYCVLNTISMATAQGTSFPSRRTPVRFVLISWSLLCILVSTVYCTGYASLLTRPQYTNEIRSIEDMVDAGIKIATILYQSIAKRIIIQYHTWLLILTTFAYVFDEEYVYHLRLALLRDDARITASCLEWGSKYPNFSVVDRMLVASNISHLQILAKRFKSFQDGARRSQLLNEGHYALFVKIIGRTYASSSENLEAVASSLVCLPQCLSKTYLVLALQLNSPYKILFDRKIEQLIESGIINHWLQVIIIKRAENYMLDFFQRYPLRSDGPYSLSVKDISGAFYFLFLGSSFASVAFVVEILHRKRTRKQL